MTCQVGDWVRFQRNGGLVIGIIEYVVPDCHGGAEYVTDQGTLDQDSVLERRSVTKKEIRT